MLRPDQPTADAALLVYLSSVLSLFLGAALFMYGLMQPTVLPNAGLAGFETQKQRAVVLLAVIAGWVGQGQNRGPANPGSCP